jgi:mannosyltransferase OCH1-like enzyme
MPKIIHRVWLGGEMPEEFVEFGEEFVELNPGYVLWDWSSEEVFDTRWINQAVIDQMIIESRQPGADMVAFYTHVADVIDYELVHEYGGWYFNTDVKPLKPFRDLWLQGYNFNLPGLAMEDDVHAVNMAMYAPRANDALYAAIIEELPGRYFGMPGAYMNATTGVQLIMSVLPRFPYTQLYHRNVFNPIHFSDFGYGEKANYRNLAYPPETIATHLWMHRTNQRAQRVLET